MFQGEVTWASAPQDPPFQAPPLSPFTNNSKMFYIAISDYVFNSMTYTAYKKGFLGYKLTAGDVRNGILLEIEKQRLNWKCVGLMTGTTSFV